MKIGINARCLSSNQTGIGRYVNQLCKVINKKENDVICYLPKKIHSTFNYIDGVKYREANHHNLIQKLYWENVLLPSKVRKDNVDVFWEPAHRLPISLIKKVPIVLTIHDLVWLKAPKTMKLKSWLAECLLTSYSIKSADIVVTASHATKKDLEEHFPFKQSVVQVVTPGITSLSHQIPTSKVKKSKFTKPFFLIVGTIEPRKNHVKLLEAYANLSDETKEKAHLVIVGGKGWGGINLANHIYNLGLNNYVHYLEYIDDDNLASLYQECLFLAMPSLYEGFGMPIAEAMSFGKPILTSNISSMPEVSQNAGLLISPDNKDEIKVALEKLIESEHLRSRLSVYAKENAKQFCWSKSSEKLIEAFSLAINQARTS